MKLSTLALASALVVTSPAVAETGQWTLPENVETLSAEEKATSCKDSINGRTQDMYRKKLQDLVPDLAEVQKIKASEKGLTAMGQDQLDVLNSDIEWRRESLGTRIVQCGAAGEEPRIFDTTGYELGEK